jgi:hypothetical protein
MSDDLTPRMTDHRVTDLPHGSWHATDVPTGRAEWYRFAYSYKAAADELADATLTNRWRRNVLGLPMLFLYRHYVELHLKSLLADAGELLDDPQTIPPEHYISKLWQRVRALILRIGPSDEDAWFARADAIVAELDSLDPNSFAFRYPVNKRGVPSLAEPLLVDPQDVKSVIAELDVLLEGASSQIAVFASYKQQGY